MANLNTLFDEIKDTVNVDPKLKGLLQGLIENVKGKDDIIVELQNRVHFLDNKVNEMEIYSSKDCVILQNLPLRSGNFTQDVLTFLNEVMGVEVNSYDLKACHPLGPVSQNQKCVVIVKFVYFDIKNRIYGRKKLLKDFLHPVNKQPVYITERLTQRDSELLDYSRGLGMYTVTYNCAPQVFVSKADGGFQRHNLVDIKDADQIFKNKNPMMARQANNVRKQNPRVIKNIQNNFSRPPIVSVRKRDREITPNNVERNHLIDELYSRVSDPVKLVQFVESLQRDSPQSKFVNNGNNNHENDSD